MRILHPSPWMILLRQIRSLAPVAEVIHSSPFSAFHFFSEKETLT